MAKIVLGLTGKKGSGKTTIAKYIEKKYGFKKISISTRLKKIIRDEFGILHSKDIEEYKKDNIPKPEYYTAKQVYDKLIKYAKGYHINNRVMEYLMAESIKISNLISQCIDNDDKDNYARLLYQHVGTEFFRSIDENFWISKVIFDIITDTNTRFVIDDIRFLNEFLLLKGRFTSDFKMVYVESDENNEVDEHISESFFEILKVNSDYHIKNTKSEEIFSDVDNMFRTFYQKDLAQSDKV